MYSKIYWLAAFADKGKVGIMARPRGGDWLEEEILNLKRQSVSALISLLEQRETHELELNNEKILTEKKAIQFISLPIKDRSIPEDEKKTSALINTLVSYVQQDKTIVIHCRMGIGRSSIIAAAVLIKLGMKADSVLAHISKIRGLSVPDTDEQKLWLKKWSTQLN